MLKIIRTLEQEYRYTILDRLIAKQIYEHPELAAFERLERAMLVTQTDKLTASFSVGVDLHSVEKQFKHLV
jgi:hypothetical protein